MYKYGETILVQLPNGRFYPRVFIHMDLNNYAVCVSDCQEKKFKEGAPFDTKSWEVHSSFSEKYKPSEMIGKKVKIKESENYVIIVEADSIHFSYVMKGSVKSYLWTEFNDLFEVMED